MTKSLFIIISFSLMLFVHQRVLLFSDIDVSKDYEKGTIFRSHDLLFGLDHQIEVIPDDMQLLVQYLKLRPKVRIEIGVHTDNRASSQYSSEPSHFRANKVKEYLMNQGIAEHRMEVHGYSSTQLLMKNAKYEIEHRLNRRVEIKLI